VIGFIQHPKQSLKSIKLILNILSKIGKELHLKNFPAHAEVRIDENKIIPIEVNPLRFGGFCTTADLLE
jgi:hypothetical protein